jgi:hypothetical protein
MLRTFYPSNVANVLSGGVKCCKRSIRRRQTLQTLQTFYPAASNVANVLSGGIERSIRRHPTFYPVAASNVLSGGIKRSIR